MLYKDIIINMDQFVPPEYVSNEMGYYRLFPSNLQTFGFDGFLKLFFDFSQKIADLADSAGYRPMWPIPQNPASNSLFKKI